MTGSRRRAAGAALGLALLTAACGETGSLAISNESPHLVVVRLGDEETEVASGGGAVVMGYDCTPGDVLVVSASGETVTLDGPVCSDQQIVIDSAGTVALAPADAPD